MSFSQQIRHDKSFHLAPKSKNCQFATSQCYVERSRTGVAHVFYLCTVLRVQDSGAHDLAWLEKPNITVCSKCPNDKATNKNMTKFTVCSGGMKLLFGHCSTSSLLQALMGSWDIFVNFCFRQQHSPTSDFPFLSWNWIKTKARTANCISCNDKGSFWNIILAVGPMQPLLTIWFF